MSIYLLSHRYNETVPVYGWHDAPLMVRHDKRISAGDSSNSCTFELGNHWGTHIDAPKHFFDNGRRIADYRPDELVFTSPQLLDLPCEEGALIRIADIQGKLRAATDLLLIRTGWESLRGTAAYSKGNPGIAAEVGEWLRLEFPLLRAVGFDLISISSQLNREEGRAAHGVFLNPDPPGRPILIIEDMALVGIIAPLRQVVVAPLMLTLADSAPCTVFGFTGNGLSE